jgi:hypothetical protein
LLIFRRRRKRHLPVLMPARWAAECTNSPLKHFRKIPSKAVSNLDGLF